MLFDNFSGPNILYFSSKTSNLLKSTWEKRFSSASLSVVPITSVDMTVSWTFISTGASASVRRAPDSGFTYQKSSLQKISLLTLYSTQILVRNREGERKNSLLLYA